MNNTNDLEVQKVEVDTIDDLIKVLQLVKSTYGNIPPFIQLDHGLWIQPITKIYIEGSQLVLVGGNFSS